MKAAGWTVVLLCALPGISQAQDELPWHPVPHAVTLSPSLVTLPNPATPWAGRTGLFWTAGNPAAAAFEIEDSVTAFGVGAHHVGGTLRRPLDPATDRADDLWAAGWAPLSDRATAAGAVTVTDQTAGATLVPDLDPYGSAFTFADTAPRDMSRRGADLAGSSAWRFGRVSAGLVLNYGIRDNRGAASKLARVGHWVHPAAAAGLAWRLPFWSALFGIDGGVERTSEAMTMVANPFPGQLSLVRGLEEPGAFPVTTATPYQRHTIANVTRFGTQLGSVGGTSRWLVAAWESRRREDQSSANIVNPPTDHWNVDSIGVAGLLTSDPARPLALSLQVSWQHASGNAQRADLTGDAYRGGGTSAAGAAGLRWANANRRFAIGVEGSLSRDTEQRDDFVANAHVDATSWTPAATIDVTYRPGPFVNVQGHTGLASTVASLPDPALRAPGYVALIAPELALLAERRRLTGLGLTFGGDLGGNTIGWLATDYERVAGTPVAALAGVSPSGARTTWSVVVGVTTGLGAH